MFVADAHADTLYAHALKGTPVSRCAVQKERLRAGGVGLQTFALFAGSEGPAGSPYQDALQMLEAAGSLDVPMITGPLPDTPPGAPMGVISIEGGEVLEGSTERLHEFHRAARVRMIALTWNHENQIGYPASGGAQNKLKPFGRALIREMDKLGVLVDASHLNDAGFFDAAERTQLPVIASHSNLRTLCDVPRNLSPDQVRVIIEKQGFIGINFYSHFLRNDGEQPNLMDVFRHIDRLMELGAERVLGFGSDFDGIETWPEGLSGPQDFPNLIALLLRRGYTRAQVEGIAGLNLWRVLKQAERNSI